MPKLKLTDRFCMGATSVGSSQTDYFDEQATGLSLRVMASGKKVWNYNYTSPVSKKRGRIKLGEYTTKGGMSLETARLKAALERGKLIDGVDPAVSRREAESASLREQTVQTLVQDYMQRHVALHELRSGKQIEARFNRNVIPLIGKVRLSALHRRDVVRVVNAVVGRGSLTEANRTFDNLRALIRWAVGQGVLDVNIMDAMPRPAKTQTRDRVLNADEIVAVFNGHHSLKTSENVIDIIHLLFATGCRAAEIGELEKSEVDLENRVINLPARRVKNGRNFSVPLTDSAIQILSKAVERNPGHWVFPNRAHTGGTNSDVIAKAINRMRDRIGVVDWTAHDIRRTWATLAGELGVLPHVIAASLNHVSVNSGVTFAHYLKHDYMKERRKAHALVEAHINGMRLGVDNVISFGGSNG